MGTVLLAFIFKHDHKNRPPGNFISLYYKKDM
jgi:hypothetical protein